MSKQIKKEIRAIKRMTRRAEVENILKEYKDLKRISGIKSQRKKDHTPSMINKDGQAEHERQSIADVFATFYEQLYKDTDRNTNDNNHDPPNNTQQRHSNDNDERDHHNDYDNDNSSILPFTMKELCKALQYLKKGKAPDGTGIVAEMLQSGGHTLKEILLQLYNTIVQPQQPPPDTWRHTLIKVLHKSGDARLPQNYRPIATIPMLYKLFARLLYNRLEPVLDNQQHHDQAGFRKNRSTTDHLFTTTIIQEICDEWQLPMWIAAVDFKKAFDSVTHEGLWSALAEQGVEPAYVHLLSKLYHKQTAKVKTDRLSRCFNIERGVKQGDPLSTLLFNCVSESLMRKIKSKWNTKRWGMRLQAHDSTERLTNLRFADDILLFATSRQHITNMLTDLSIEAGKLGLQLHPDKTKILHNEHSTTTRQRTPTHATVNNMTVEILSPGDSTKYLGRKLSFSTPHKTEVESRISFAWRKWFLLKQELTGHRYSLTDRLRLFHGTVTPTILYGCEAWTLTAELENRLQRTQRQMLRMILHAPRRKTRNNEHVHNNRYNGNSSNTDNDTATQTTPPPGAEALPELLAQPQPQPLRQPTTTTSTTSAADITEIVMNATSTSSEDDRSDVDSDASTHQMPLRDDHDEEEMEPWVDFIRRCTHEIEARTTKLKLDDWVTIARRRKWKWAQKLATNTKDTWTTMALSWDPTVDIQLNARRRTGRPKTRWWDDICKHVQHHSTTTTSNNNTSNNTNQHHDDTNTDATDDHVSAPIDQNIWLDVAKDPRRWAALEDLFAIRGSGRLMG